MAAKKVNKSNVRQDDPYDAANYNYNAKKRFDSENKDWYWKEVARTEDLVMNEQRPKYTGGAAGATVTEPYLLRKDAEKRTETKTRKTKSPKN